MTIKTACLLLLCVFAVSVQGFVPRPSIKAPSAHASVSPLAMSSSSNNPLESLLGNMFGGGTKAAAVEEEPPALPDVVIDPDFKLAGIFLTLGLVLDTIPYIQLTLGPLVTLLGLLFLVQTLRIRFVFTQDAFELKMGNGKETGENIVVGGANRWDYTSFVNYDFFPKGWIDQPQGPILVYFKETQTPSDKWNEGPGKTANSPKALEEGAVPGQVHFFPALCNTKQLRAEFERRNCQKLD